MTDAHRHEDGRAPDRPTEGHGGDLAVPPVSVARSDAVSRGWQIRLATAAEYDEVGEITVRGYVHDGYLSASDDYASRLRDARSRAEQAELWVAVDDSRGLLGSVTVCPLGSPYRELANDTEGEFRMLAVDPAARGLGVGRALVRHCLDHSAATGFEGVVICSLPAMTAAHALYRSMGFGRDVSLDWSPVPGVELWGFRIVRLPENHR